VDLIVGCFRLLVVGTREALCPMHVPKAAVSGSSSVVFHRARKDARMT
jgi:hypothetical protein